NRIMRKVLVLSFMLFGAFGLMAQEEEKKDETPEPLWKKSASFGLNITNVGLSNWAGGGENSFAISGLVKASANYKNGPVSWNNSFEAGYGLVKQGEVEEFRKSDDRLIAVSKYSKAFGESDWAYTALVDFRSQMTDGFTYSEDEDGNTIATTISRLMAPGYLTTSLGGEYKPNDNFYMMASPISGKLTFVMDETLSNAAAFGVDTGKTVRAELGAIFNMKFKKDLAENINFETKLNLFQAYRKDAMVDIMWDNLLEMKVNDFISSTISTQMIYDEDVKFLNEDGTQEARLQFKYVFNVGFLYKF
ncbi:MAG: DUF3078 domain-containing protein, partial [Bacteroidia bacterium]